MRWTLYVGVLVIDGVLYIERPTLLRLLFLPVFAALTVAAEVRVGRRQSGVADRCDRRLYQASVEQSYRALCEAVANLGYRVTIADPSAATLEFNTGISGWSWAGQDYRASVRQLEEEMCEVVLDGSVALSRFGPAQLVSGGETRRLAAKVLGQVDARLGAGSVHAA